MKEFIWQLITDLTGVTCIWAHESGVKPEKFILLQIVSTDGFGDDRKKRVYDEDSKMLKSIISGIKEGILSVNAYGTGANLCLATLWQKLSTEIILDKSFLNGVSFLNASRVLDLTELVDSLNWKERAQMDITFCYTQEIEDNTHIIDKVNIGGIFTHPKDKPKKEITDFAVNIDIKTNK